METCRGFLICRVPPIHHRCHLNRCGVSPGNPNKPRAIRGRRLSGLIAPGISPQAVADKLAYTRTAAPLPCGKTERGCNETTDAENQCATDVG